MKLNPKEERAAKKLLAAIQAFRTLDGDMQLPMAASFLIVALNDGVSRTEVMNELGVAGSTATRNLMGLMESGRLGRPGHALIDQRVNPEERRWRMHSLTPKGRKFLKQLAAILEEDEAT
ncbi:MAG: MarR family winged helix-turn-helix transcriptional regulator [Pseudomonadota bacterium]